jgi:predicted dehydrogenase
MERRDFLKTAGAGLTALAGAPAILAQKSPNDTLGIACVGVGTRGFQLLQWAQAVVPNSEVRIVCDLYKMNTARALKMVKNPKVREVHEWEKAIADPDIDAVLVATPDFWHAPMVIAAAQSKKDVYCEKGWCRTLKEAKAMRKAVKDNERVLQLGHNYNSMAYFLKAKEIYQSGALGKCPLVRLYIDRTSAFPEWKFYATYTVNELPKEATAENIDWQRFLANAEDKHRPFDPERFFRWRNWWEYGTGIAGDLMSHLWDSANGVAGMGIPETVFTQGDLYWWKGDRDVPDQWHVIYDYPKREMAMTFECVFHNRHQGELLQFLGREKTMEVSPRFLRTYEGEWKPGNADRAAAARKLAEEAPQLGMGSDELVAPDYVMPKPPDDWWGAGHMVNFLECVRSRQTPRCGVDRAFEEAATIAMSVESHKRQRKVRWDAAKEEIVAI